MSERLTMAEIASRIDAHLKRFQADPEINKPYSTGRRPFYFAGAHFTKGHRLIRVWYISYHGESKLTRRQAEQYLEWLDAGNVGRHWEAERAARGGAI